MKCLDDFRMNIAGTELVPIMIGGMGVDISTTKLALVAAKEGGVGHISDAMAPTVTDRLYDTKFVRDKQKKYKYNAAESDKVVVQFDLDQIREAQRIHVSKSMDQKQGDGLIYINVMEKLGMNNPKETLKARLEAALDAGIDGITLSAGLHLGSFALMKDHPRFREAHLGIIVSSVRALNLFIRKTKKLARLPDYVVVEGPRAGGHLGFGMDWADYDLGTITQEVVDWIKDQGLDIPVIAAGGIFTGSDAVRMIEEHGAAGVQVATRFTVTEECGLPDSAKQEYFKATEDMIEVNQVSPTGYPMRMLTNTPALCSGIRPNCEAYGYLLDANGKCAYIDAWNREVEAHPDAKIKDIHVCDKICMCTHMRKFDCWTCGAETHRLKDTSFMEEDGNYHMLKAIDVFNDYRYSKDDQVAVPGPE